MKQILTLLFTLSTIPTLGMIGNNSSVEERDVPINPLMLNSYFHAWQFGKDYIMSEDETHIDNIEKGQDIKISYEYYVDKTDYDFYTDLISTFPAALGYDMSIINFYLIDEFEDSVVWSSAEGWTETIDLEKIKFDQVVEGSYTIESEKYLDIISIPTNENINNFILLPLWGAPQNNTNENSVFLYGNDDSAKVDTGYEKLWLNFNPEEKPASIWYEGESTDHPYWYGDYTTFIVNSSLSPDTIIDKISIVVEDKNDRNFKREYDVTDISKISESRSTITIPINIENMDKNEYWNRNDFLIETKINWTKGTERGTSSTVGNANGDYDKKELIFERLDSTIDVTDFSESKNTLSLIMYFESNVNHKYSAETIDIFLEDESGLLAEENVVNMPSRFYIPETVGLSWTPSYKIEYDHEYSIYIKIGELKYMNYWGVNKTYDSSINNIVNFKIDEEGDIVGIPDRDEGLPLWMILIIGLAIITSLILILSLIIKRIKK